MVSASMAGPCAWMSDPDARGRRLAPVNGPAHHATKTSDRERRVDQARVVGLPPPQRRNPRTTPTLGTAVRAGALGQRAGHGAITGPSRARRHSHAAGSADHGGRQHGQSTPVRRPWRPPPTGLASAMPGADQTGVPDAASRSRSAAVNRPDRHPRRARRDETTARRPGHEPADDDEPVAAAGEPRLGAGQPGLVDPQQRAAAGAARPAAEPADGVQRPARRAPSRRWPRAPRPGRPACPPATCDPASGSTTSDGIGGNTLSTAIAAARPRPPAASTTDSTAVSRPARRLIAELRWEGGCSARTQLRRGDASPASSTSRLRAVLRSQ